jgi:hypothetical protein
MLFSRSQQDSLNVDKFTAPGTPGEEIALPIRAGTPRFGDATENKLAREEVLICMNAGPRSHYHSK